MSSSLTRISRAFQRYSKVVGTIAATIGAIKTIVSTLSQAYEVAQTAGPVFHIAIKAVEQAFLFAGFGLFWLALVVWMFGAFDKVMWKVICGTAFSLSLLALLIGALIKAGGIGQLVDLVTGFINAAPGVAITGWVYAAVSTWFWKMNRNG